MGKVRQRRDSPKMKTAGELIPAVHVSGTLCLRSVAQRKPVPPLCLSGSHPSPELIDVRVRRLPSDS